MLYGIPDIKAHTGGALGAQYLRSGFCQRLDVLGVQGLAGNDESRNNLPAGNLQKIVPGLGPASSNALNALRSMNMTTRNPIYKSMNATIMTMQTLQHAKGNSTEDQPADAVKPFLAK